MGALLWKGHSAPKFELMEVIVLKTAGRFIFNHQEI